jgi:biopolymer transport protein ExbB/TolQ
MSSNSHLNRILKVLLRILIIAALVSAVILSGRSTDFLSAPGLVYMLLGCAATALMGFSASEIGLAFKHTAGRVGARKELQKSAYFWEISVRNAWNLGVLGSIIGFITALGSSEGGLLGIMFRMSRSFLTTVYGMVLGVVFLVPAMKLIQKLKKNPQKEISEAYEASTESISKTFRFENIVGYILFIAVMGWIIISSLGSIEADSPIKPSQFFTYWPSLLVVLGGTIAIVVFIGNGLSGQLFTLGFALTGLLGTLLGFVQVLLGMSTHNIEDVASALTFIISSCLVALLGIMLIGAPLEDHAFKAEKKKERTLSRIAWYVFPMFVLIVLVLAFILVITPIKK